VTDAPQQDQQDQEAAPQRLEDLKRKMKLTGTVKKVELFGAFVDVGVGRDGLIHISALSSRPVAKVEDVVKAGDTVTVWVRKVDPVTGRIDLTLVEPAALEWDEIKPGQVYPGKVVKLERFGAFVDIGAERPGLVHISELATYRVEEVSEIVKMGQDVEVKVLGVDPRKRQIKLSMKALDSYEPEPEEQEEAPLTAMQIALRKAQEDARQSKKDRSKQKNERGRQAQEDIFSRTLANKRK
jgi:small subunit ribosomal protein S1